MLLAFKVLVAGGSYKGTCVFLDAQRLAYTQEHELDHVSAVDLGIPIMEDHPKYRVLDFRDSAIFGAYDIPWAENISLTALMDADYQRDGPIVICSEAGSPFNASNVASLDSGLFSRVYAERRDE